MFISIYIFLREQWYNMADKLTPDQRKKLMINYLPRSVDVDQLKAMFEKYGPVANAHIVKNTATNESKGYGFITFHDENSSEPAINELNGQPIEDKRLRVAYSTPIDDNNRTKAVATSSGDDVNVYIANLPKTWDEKELTARFETYGPVKHCKILRDNAGVSRGAGFVRYETSKMAAAAILDMDDRCPEGGTLPLIVKIADGKKKDKAASSASINHSGLPGLVLNHNPATASVLQAMTVNNPSTNGYSQHSHTAVDHRYNPYSKPPSHSQTPPPSAHAYTHPGAYPPIGSSYSSASGSHSSLNPYPSPYSSSQQPQSNSVIPGYNPPVPPHSHPMMQAASTPPVPAAAINNKNNHYCVYIGNLPETTCKSCLLYQLFSPYGAIANVKPMSNVKPDGGNDHWFAFVNFKNYSDAGQAIQALNGSTLNGRSLKVDFKTEKRK